MTSTAFTVLVYFNGSIYVEDNYSDKFISSNTAWVTITNTMTLSQLKQAILKEFNCATLDDYEVDLRYRLPIFISGDITHYRSCTMCGDDDVESIFYMGMTKACHLPVEIMAFITARQNNAIPDEVYFDFSNNFNMSLNLDWGLYFLIWSIYFYLWCSSSSMFMQFLISMKLNLQNGGNEILISYKM